MGNVGVLRLASCAGLRLCSFAEICADTGPSMPILLAGVFYVVTVPGLFGQDLATHSLVDNVGSTSFNR